MSIESKGENIMETTNKILRWKKNGIRIFHCILLQIQRIRGSWLIETRLYIFLQSTLASEWFCGISYFLDFTMRLEHTNRWHQYHYIF